MTPVQPLPAEPRLAALSAARGAGVTITMLDTVEELECAAAIVNDTWPEEISISMLRALRKAGNFVSGAWCDDRLVGACIGFFGRADGTGLHSHLAVTDRRFRARGIGAALKLHQRAWAINSGIERIYWTYDPLQRRNAHMNLNKLAATPVEYLENFYGDHGDNTERPFPTDRLMVEWSLRSAPVIAATENRYPVLEIEPLREAGCVTLLMSDVQGMPAVCPDNGAVYALIGTPADTTTLRRDDPELALDWLLQVRHHMQTALASGGRISGFTRGGFYVLDRTASATSAEETPGPISSTQGSPS